MVVRPRHPHTPETNTESNWPLVLLRQNIFFVLACSRSHLLARLLSILPSQEGMSEAGITKHLESLVRPARRPICVASRYRSAAQPAVRCAGDQACALCARAGGAASAAGCSRAQWGPQCACPSVAVCGVDDTQSLHALCPAGRCTTRRPHVECKIPRVPRFITRSRFETDQIGFQCGTA